MRFKGICTLTCTEDGAVGQLHAELSLRQSLQPEQLSWIFCSNQLLERLKHHVQQCADGLRRQSSSICHLDIFNTVCLSWQTVGTFILQPDITDVNNDLLFMPV